MSEKVRAAKDILLEYRWKLKMTQSEMAKYLGVQQHQLCRWEKGQHVPAKLRWESILEKMNAKTA